MAGAAARRRRRAALQRAGGLTMRDWLFAAIVAVLMGGYFYLALVL